MNRTKIEWCDYTVNPVKGLCPVACPYCYARRMYKRYHWDETVRFDPEVLISNKEFEQYRSHPRVFVGSTFELFGPWVDDDWLFEIFSLIENIPATFIFLTKRPENLLKWSPFPKNVWVGVSATNASMLTHAVVGLDYIEAPVKFISLEPILSWDMTRADIGWTFEAYHLNWLIIGQQTPVSAKTAPKVEWVREIVEAADKAKVPVFLKNNLKELLPTERIFRNPKLPDWATFWELRQEFPRV